MGQEETLHRGWVWDSAACLHGRERGCSRLHAISHMCPLIERSWELLSALAMNLSPCLCIAQEHSMPSNAFILGANSSAHPPLGLRSVRPHSFWRVRWVVRHTPLGVGLWFSSYLDLCKLASRASKTQLRVQIMYICTLPNSLVKCTPNLVLQMGIAASWHH